jgi:hypothetical protein
MTKVILFDLDAGTSRRIATAPRRGIVFPGTVNGDWVSWTQCSPTDCGVWRYRITTQTKTEIRARARLVYTSAVGTGRDGVVQAEPDRLRRRCEAPTGPCGWAGDDADRLSPPRGREHLT